MRIGDTSNRDWKGALRELAIIIAGVIIALGANAWWAARTDRAREKEYLSELSGDLTATLQNLDDALRQEMRTAAATDSLLVAVYSKQPMNPDSVRAWASLVGHYSDPRLVMGTITALQQTGDLGLITNERIRVGVSSYASRITEDWTEFSRWIDYALAGGKPMGDAAVRRGLYVPGAIDNTSRALMTLRNDPEVVVSLRSLRSAAGNRRDYIHSMQLEASHLLDIINSK